MSQVEILCPNGHRVVINVTSNTKVLRVLDEVCLKKGFLPCTEFELRHGRKVLELSSSIQDTGLPNHAKLELVKCSKPWTESKVLVQLQTSDGTRVQRDFVPTTTIYELLESFEEDDGRGGHCKLLYCKEKFFHPVVIYVKEEIIGEFALKGTTLRNLGIIAGRVSLRHMFREVSEVTLATIKDQLLRDQTYMEKLKNKSVDLSRDSNISSENYDHNHENRVGVHHDDDDDDDGFGGQDKKQKFVSEVNKNETSKNLKQRTENKQDTSTINKKYNDDGNNDDNNDDDDEVANPRVPSLMASGFDFEKEDNVMIQPFLYTGFKFPEETKGKAVYRNDISDVKLEEYKPCNRELMFYRLDEQMLVDDTVFSEVPDNFFEVNENDLQVLQRDLQKNVQQLSDQPLMTQSMRRMEMEMKLARYDKVIIRIQFPDRHIAQGIFRPKETVYALYKFVREMLVDKTLDFELYTTPPKQTLNDMTLTLLEANLVPMTRVYFTSASFKSHSTVRDDLLHNLSSRLSVETIVYKYLKDVSSHTNTTNHDKQQSTTATTTNAHKTPSAPSTNTTTAKSKTVPKWLTLGKK